MAQFIDNEKVNPSEEASIRELAGCLSHPLSISTIIRAVTALLQAHYSTSNNFWEAAKHLSCLTYGKNGSLHIGATGVFEPGKTDTYPGIFISGGNVKLLRVSAGNAVANSYDMSSTSMGKIKSMQVTIHHIHSDMTVATDLAEMTADVLLGFSAELIRSMGLQTFSVEAISAAKKLEEAPTRFYDTAVTLRVDFLSKVAFYVESHRIKKFNVDISQ